MILINIVILTLKNEGKYEKALDSVFSRNVKT